MDACPFHLRPTTTPFSQAPAHWHLRAWPTFTRMHMHARPAHRVHDAPVAHRGRHSLVAFFPVAHNSPVLQDSPVRGLFLLGRGRSARAQAHARAHSGLGAAAPPMPRRPRVAHSGIDERGAADKRVVVCSGAPALQERVEDVGRRPAEAEHRRQLPRTRHGRVGATAAQAGACRPVLRAICCRRPGRARPQHGQ